MPNWCDADVMIYSNSREELERLITQASQGTHEIGEDWNKETNNWNTVREIPNKFSFENFLPTPKEKLEGDGWYDWRVANWGTKWDIEQENLGFDIEIRLADEPELPFKYSIGLGFQTAWSPALPVFEKIAQDFDVYIEYKFIEEGANFFGIARIDSNGIAADVREPSIEDYKIAGCVIDEKGEIDWDNTDEYDLYLALDYWKEYEEESSK